MATLREIQLAELSVLKEIHRVCEENNIAYAMSCGTMLGAVRHKGFIPWDDDLDIYMSYKNFKKFAKVFKSDTCFLQTEKTDPDMPYVMYKVRKNNTQMTEKDFEKIDIHQGVWVDIFLYFDAPKSIKGKKIQSKLMILLQTIRCRANNKANNQENAIQKALNKMPLSLAQKVDSFVYWMARAIGSKKSKDYYMTVNNVFEKLYYPKNVIDGQALYEFEDGQYYGLENWNGYLTHEYGSDYMTPRNYGSHIESFDDVLL